MGKLTGFIAGAALTLGMGAANAEKTSEILGAADYQAMSQSEMSSITGERNITRNSSNINRNVNISVCTPRRCEVFSSSTSRGRGRGANININVVVARVIAEVERLVANVRRGARGVR